MCAAHTGTAAHPAPAQEVFCIIPDCCLASNRKVRSNNLAVYFDQDRLLHHVLYWALLSIVVAQKFLGTTATAYGYGYGCGSRF